MALGEEIYVNYLLSCDEESCFFSGDKGGFSPANNGFGVRQIMLRTAASTAAIAAVCLSACAGAAPSTKTTGDDQPVVAPLESFYDVAWIRSADGSVRTLEEVADDLGKYDVVFFGEDHTHPGNHLAQMRLLQALHQRNANMTLSLEQFERDTQPIVDQYLAGEIGEKVLEKDARAWPNYKGSYRPLVEYAVEHQLPVIAANAPKEIVVCVGKEGVEILDRIPEPDRSWVAETINVDEGAYMDKFIAIMSGGATHGGGDSEPEDEASEDEASEDEAPGDEEAGDETGGDTHEISPQMRAMVLRSFAAQVTRDDTMAESIARHLGDHPERKVLHLNGNFHSASHLGAVERLTKRMPGLRVAVIQPVGVADHTAPAWTDEDLGTGDYLLLIRDLPDAFVTKERQMEFQRDLMSKRSGNECVYAEEPAQEE